jgi:UDP-glucose 4-epimerase
LTKFLVTGAAGYIGSTIAFQLQKNGYDIIGIDDLSTGRQEFVPREIEFIQGSILDLELMLNIGSEVDGIIHAAGIKFAHESMMDPQNFYQVNLQGSLNVAIATRNTKRKILVFSSSCSIYGDSDVEKIKENSPANPISPYGRSKHMAELMYNDFSDAYKLKYVGLRYFNVIGASENGAFDGSKFNLFPNLTRAIQENNTFALFGSNLPTDDGSCVRDYVDVNDIANAHLICAEKLMKDEKINREYNLGVGRGFSTLEIIHEFEKQTFSVMKIEDAGFRQGDPISIQSDSSSARKDLNWHPAVDLTTSVQTHLKHFTEFD